MKVATITVDKRDDGRFICIIDRAPSGRKLVAPSHFTMDGALANAAIVLGRDIARENATARHQLAMKSKKVFRDGMVHVQARMCATCIFRPGNLMRLTPGRVDELVAAAARAQSCIPCHETTHGGAEAVCAGFYRKHPTLPLQVARALDRIVFVAPPRKGTSAAGTMPAPGTAQD